MPLSKRILDVLLTSAGMVGALPVLGLLALAVRSTLGAPVFFVQERPGLGGLPFQMYKFRTMTDERDSAGRLLPDEERLTRLGRTLRSTSLDELPGLLNVLKGEMSLVGPRPLLMRYLDRYTPEQAKRHQMPPGITGWAQVNGRNALSWEKKLQLDVWYVKNWSLGLDVKILAMTILKVLLREGISQEGQATMEEFMGSDPSTRATSLFRKSRAH
jgi:lipopolysaccharide/colanic/teichoic acid biosynthesis glycosyltransferase